MKKRLFSILKYCTAATLVIALVTGLTQTGFSPGKEAKAAALTFQTGSGTASKPAFNSDNFPSLNTTAETKYYYGKFGNAFYGAPANGVGFTDSQTWELVDTDSSMDGTPLSSTWGSSSSSGQQILDYTNGLTNTYFSTADQKAMKSKSVAIDTYLLDSDYSGTETGSIGGAKLWPLSVKQMMQSGVTPSDNTREQVTNFEKKLYSNAGGRVWTRSFGGSHNHPYAWMLDSDNVSGYVTSSFYGLAPDPLRVAPALALDLTKVLMTRSASSEVSQTPLSSASVASGNLKFLINAGTKKSNFNIAAISGKKLTNVYNGKTYQFDYSGASTSPLNGGKNYVSAIIYDSKGKIVYYGNLKTIDSETGKASITIPSDLAEGQDYTLALFEEEKCAANMTDYASTPVYASFTAKNKMTLNYDVTINGGTSTAPSSVQDIEPDTVFDVASGVFDKTADRQGWTFVGWNTNKDAHEALTSLTMDSDKTLYAIFKKDLTVKFIDSGS